MKPVELLFKAEDFEEIDFEGAYYDSKNGTAEEQVAKRANELLRESLEKAPKMYCYQMRLFHLNYPVWLAEQDLGEAGVNTHNARLVCIERIKKP